MAFAGFGGIIIPITLGAHFYPMKWMITVLVPMILLSNAYILIFHHRHIDWQVLLKEVLPFMSYIYSGRMNAASIKFSMMCIPSLLLGSLIGEFLHHRVDEKLFKIFIFMILTLSGLSIVIR